MKKLIHFVLCVLCATAFAGGTGTTPPAPQPTGAVAITGGTIDGTTIGGDGVNVLAQRNGTNAQSLRVYNTYTDASNYERVSYTWASNIFDITSEAAGTGTARDLRLNSGTTLVFRTAGTDRLFTSSTFFRPAVNAGLDLGAASFGWKRIYVDYTNTGTVGAVTINKAAGRVNMAASGTSFTVTNSLVTAASHCFLNADGAPGNVVAVQFYAVPAAGSFTVNAVPAVTNQTAIDFFCVNAD